MSPNLFKNGIKMCLEIKYLIYMDKKDLPLNNLKWLVYHKTKTRQISCYQQYIIKVMDYGMIVSEFEHQSRYYVHFRANTLGKDMNPLILPARG